MWFGHCENRVVVVALAPFDDPGLHPGQGLIFYCLKVIVWQLVLRAENRPLMFQINGVFKDGAESYVVLVGAEHVFVFLEEVQHTLLVLVGHRGLD